MKVWLPYVFGGSGTDVYTRILARGLKACGIEVVASAFAHKWQYYPWRLKYVSAPPGIDLIIANSWNGFAFARSGVRLIVVEHLCLFDRAYLPYRSTAQAIFHEGLVRRFELASMDAAAAVVAVSRHTAECLNATLGISDAEVIHNGIDTRFFTPATETADAEGDGIFRLLFVGNPSRRKGADLLSPIMQRLGTSFELHYTSGLRDETRLGRVPNAHDLGSLNHEQLRNEYRRADLLLFPSRLEGFAYSPLEAMACGTPVIAANASSLGEMIAQGKTGVLCATDDVDGFVSSIQALAADREHLRRLGEAARRRMVQEFTIDRMAHLYSDLVRRVAAK